MSEQQNDSLEKILSAPPLKGETPEGARARRLRWLKKAKYYINAAQKRKPGTIHAQ